MRKIAISVNNRINGFDWKKSSPISLLNSYLYYYLST